MVINENCSEWREVKSGVLQWSILGPLLFTLYINDTGKGLTNSILNFADDTKLWGKVNSKEDVVRSEEHTSELQSRPHLVCRLLLEKKKKNREPSMWCKTYRPPTKQLTE